MLCCCGSLLSCSDVTVCLPARAHTEPPHAHTPLSCTATPPRCPQKFRILDVNPARPTLVLADPNLTYGTAEQLTQGMPTAADSNSKRQRRLGRPGPGGFAAARLPRSMEDAARRAELSRVADELRSVLAMRPDDGGSPPPRSI